MSLEKRIKKTRTIKEISLKTYIRNLNNLYEIVEDGEDFDSLTWLLDYEKIYDYLETLTTTTKKNYYTAILVALSTNPKISAQVKDLYEDDLNMSADEYMEEMKTQKLTPKQEKNWVRLSILQEIVKKRGVDATKLLEKPDWNTRDFQKFQLYIIGLLYTEIEPMRNDYADMKVITKMEWSKLSSKDKSEGDLNYIVVDKDGDFHFNINTYKTDKTYGERYLPVEPNSTLSNAISLWLERNKTGWFLITRDRRPLNPNVLTKAINRVFEPDTGKKISSTLLRHIYLSERYVADYDQKRQDAYKMGHSINTQQNIYVKHVPDHI